MIVRQRSTSKRRGGVLIACLAIVMTMAAMSAMLLQLEANRARQQLFGADQKRALNLAEAGLAEAYYGLSIGLTGNVGTQSAPARFGDGLFWVEATELENDLVSIESTGMCGAGRATLGLVVRRAPVSIASLGVMGGDSVTVGNRALIDSYDSREGPAPTGETPDSASFRLQSNGDITVGANARVAGDATPGPAGSVILSVGAVVEGATAPSNAPVTMPTIDVPELPARASVSPLVPSHVTISSTEAFLDKAFIGAASKLTIEGPATLALDKLAIFDLGHLHLDTTNGPITLYVKEYLNFASTAKVTFSHRDPKQVSLLVAASETKDHNGDLLPDAPVNFNYSGAFFGSLYASHARLALPNDFQFFGALSAKQLVLGARSQVHFDVALENMSMGDASSVQKLSWRVIDVPSSIARNFSPDPYKSLGVDEHALEKPSEAHEDAAYQIHIQYLDLAMVQRSYRGPEAGFDWGQVLTVIKILRQPM